MRKISKLLYLIPLIIISMISIIPFYFIVSMATHSTSEIYRGDLLLFGGKIFENLKTIISGGFLKYYWNSFFTSIVASVLSVAVSMMASHALTVYDFKFKKFISSFIVITMMIPGQISLLGFTVEMRNFKLINTPWPLIFTWAASSYSIYFITQFMKRALPMELVESARIDGCNEFRTFLSIVAPMTKPALGTQFMLIFLWSWNNFMMPSTVLTDSKKFTIPLGIQTLATAYTQDWGARGVALAISVLPMLIIFACGSKYFIKGLSAGAVKG